jgi:hypothetical protein
MIAQKTAAPLSRRAAQASKNPAVFSMRGERACVRLKSFGISGALTKGADRAFCGGAGKSALNPTQPLRGRACAPDFPHYGSGRPEGSA